MCCLFCFCHLRSSLRWTDGAVQLSFTLCAGGSPTANRKAQNNRICAVKDPNNCSCSNQRATGQQWATGTFSFLLEKFQEQKCPVHLVEKQLKMENWLKPSDMMEWTLNSDKSKIFRDVTYDIALQYCYDCDSVNHVQQRRVCFVVSSHWWRFMLLEYWTFSITWLKYIPLLSSLDMTLTAHVVFTSHHSLYEQDETVQRR